MTHEAWHAEIIISKEQVKNCLASQFPELLPLKEITCIGEGWDNQVFLVNRKIIFRFPRRKIAVALIEQENQLLKHLQSRLTLQIPNPQFIGRPGKDFPYPFHGYPLIPGFSAEQAGLTLSQRIASLNPLAEFLSQLHSINPGLASDMGTKVPVFDRTHTNETRRARSAKSRSPRKACVDGRSRKRITPSSRFEGGTARSLEWASACRTQDVAA